MSEEQNRKYFILPPGKNIPKSSFIDLWQYSSKNLNDLRENAIKSIHESNSSGMIDYTLKVTPLNVCSDSPVMYTAYGLLVRIDSVQEENSKEDKKLS